MDRIEGILALPDGLAQGFVTFEESLVEVRRAGGGRGRAGPGVPYVLPGFIDTHVHGGGGADAMDGVDGVRRLARFHLRHGTTTLLPTTITNPWPRVMAALDAVAEVMAAPSDDLPAIAGAHLEGPFISPERLGAQPPHALAPDPERVREVVERRVVAVATLAPEVAGARRAAATLAGAGVRVSVGHTNATYEQVVALARAVRGAGGVLGFTHLFNAMSGLGSRAPGAVGAALEDADAFAELILDLHHVHAASFRAAAAAKPWRLHLVTDAIRACGLGDGPSELGGQAVIVDGGAARLADGTLAGSVLTLDAAVRHAVAAGVPLARASAMASAVPATYLGLDDRGRLAPGCRADLVVLDEDLRVREVVVAGRRHAVGA